MSDRNRAIIFGVAGAALLIVGAVGFMSTLSSDDADPTSTGGTATAPTTNGSTSPDVTTTRTATAPPPSTASPAATSAATTSPPTTEPTATTPSSPTTEVTTTDVTTTTIALEDPKDFVNALIAGQAAADIDFLTARLHPEVFTRYGGVDPCRTYLESIAFPAITLREIADPAPWDFATDGVVTTFPDAIGVEIQRVVDGETIIQELHIVYSGAELRWFTDCGEPVEE